MAKKSKSTEASNKVVQSVTSILDSLVASLPAIAPVAKGKAQKWRIDFNENGKDIFRQWIEAKTLSEPVLQRLEMSKDALNNICLQEYVAKFYEARNRPCNPQLAIDKDGIEDHVASWLFTDKFKVRLPEVLDGQDAKSVYIAAFCDVGLHSSDSEKLVHNELMLNPVIGVRPISDLLNGHFGSNREFVLATDVEKSAGRKLAAFLSAKIAGTFEPLTDDEKIAMIQRDSGITVRTGFLERVCNYARSSDELLGIFSLLIPVFYPSHAKFAINDNPVEQSNRKISAAADILGTSAFN